MLMIQAINYAEENGAKICCLSVSTYEYSKELYDCLENSAMLFVVPSGNYGLELRKGLLSYPACFNLKNVISVADMRCDGNLSLNANYSYEYIDVAAPGTDIVSLLANGQYAYQSGTSCAVPYVAGLAALTYSCALDELNSKQLKSVICSNVTISNKLKYKVKTEGFVNYKNTLLTVE